MHLNRGDVYWAFFPYEEDDTIEKERPIIVLDQNEFLVLASKVTSHQIREWDEFDVEIKEWQYAHLEEPSVARTSKTIELSTSKITKFIGTIHPEDLINILEAYYNSKS